MPPSEAAFAPSVQEKPREPAIRVEQSAYQDFPVLAEQDFAVFGQQAQDIHEAYAEVVKWLKMPYVHDDFPDHEARMRWIESLGKEKRREQDANKFRSNPVAIAILNLNNLKSYLTQAKVRVPTDMFPDLREERTKLPVTTDKQARQVIMGQIEDKVAYTLKSLNSLMVRGPYVRPRPVPKKAAS